MRRLVALMLLLPVLAFWVAAARTELPRLLYVKKKTREATVLATLRASGLPALEGTWHYIGPFDNTDNQGFDVAYPPEKEIDLARKYPGKDGKPIGWKEFPE